MILRRRSIIISQSVYFESPIMANLSSLNRLIKWKKLLLPMNTHSLLTLASRISHRSVGIRMQSSELLGSTNVKSVIIQQQQHRFSTDKRYFKESGKESLEEFRAREEKREFEHEANIANENTTQSSQKKSNAEEEDEGNAAKQAKVDAIRIKILNAALEHVPRLGWTREAIVCGAEETGMPSVVHGMFPEGGFALVSHFNRKCNEELLLYLQQETDNGKKQIDNPLEFLVDAVQRRLSMILPYKAQWPQAMSLIAIPQNASTALAQVLTLVDDICYYSGDRSVDFNWYTRRIGLATIMKMTELYMLQDVSPQQAKTWEFLKNRMDEAVQLQMVLAQSEGMTHTFQRSFNSAFITARNILGLGYNRN